MKKLFFIIILILIPLSVLADVKLEQEYPEIGGMEATQVVQKETSIQQLIKYYSTWAIVIAILASVFSLIAGGMQYLVSAGRVSVTQKAKERIKNSFLGLAILLAAYLILNTLNPQLSILTLEKERVDVGIVLFSKEGYIRFASGDQTYIEDLVEDKQAFLLTGDILDARIVLGGLFVEAWETNPGNLEVPMIPNERYAKSLQFLDTPLYAIGFWGGMDQDARVIMYSDINFQSIPDVPRNFDQDYVLPREYSIQGKFKPDGTLDGAVFVEDVKGMRIIKLGEENPERLTSGFFKTKADYINLTRTEFLSKTEDERQDLLDWLSEAVLDPEFKNDFARTKTDANAFPVFHPPLSFKIKRTAPGLYLYSKSGEERYLNALEDDFSDFHFNFDDQTEKVELRNVREVLDEGGNLIIAEQRDFIALLHDDSFQSGNLKIFFKARTDTSETIPKMCDEQRKPRLEGNACGFEPADAFDQVDDFKDYPGKIQYLEEVDVGNTREKERVLIGGDADIYGLVEHVSSATIYELSSDPSVCKEVLLCTEKGTSEIGRGRGKCISYSSKGNKVKEKAEEGVVKLPMPLYTPVNLPDNIKVVSNINKETGAVEMKAEDFNSQIRSIFVDGACLVVLFENKIEFNPQAKFKGWNNVGKDAPGPHSQAFVDTDIDLTDDQIGLCGWSQDLLRVSPDPCASSIVVFPIVRAISPEEGPGISPTPSTGGSAAWQSCLAPGSITNRGTQILDASPTLEKLLGCLAEKFPPNPPACQWWITSISDDHGMTTCQGDYISRGREQCNSTASNEPCCWHTVNSCHYGGTNCTGQSYAVDTSVASGIVNVLGLCAAEISEPINFKNEGNHYHISIDRTRCGCAESF